MDRNNKISTIHITGERVALRKESVDRNDVIRPAIDVFLASLSARRAWIEIIAPGTSVFRGWVALRKESVDRNKCAICGIEICIGRSPQGERG